MTSDKSAADGSWNHERGAVRGAWRTSGDEELDVMVVSCWWIVVFLELKKDIRELQRSVE